MNNLLIFTALTLVYLLLDAYHDATFLQARPTIKSKVKDREWHIVDSIQKGFVALTWIYFLGSPSLLLVGLYGIYFMFVRAIWFNLWINIFRSNVKTFHLSKDGIEGWVANYSPAAYWIIGILGIISLQALILYIVR